MREVITVDGPSGVGKGTLCQKIARDLRWAYLDSGALYRLLALQSWTAKISEDDAVAIAAQVVNMNIEFVLTETNCAVKLNGTLIGEQLRSESCGNAASKIAAYPEVREALLGFQRQFASPYSLVADGRDMGTVIFPDAKLKIFLTASPEVRAERRYKQLLEKGEYVNLRDLYTEIAERDLRDRTRSVAPLKPASDAVVIDTGNLSIQDVQQRVHAEIVARFPSI
ncbi:MAG: (d)CMP kinase [Cardiobacteriaceae bacterium]|nr:(d)CMP kinase [Cardiobacteriaceae bacterium]